LAEEAPSDFIEPLVEFSGPESNEERLSSTHATQIAISAETAKTKTPNTIAIPPALGLKGAVTEPIAATTAPTINPGIHPTKTIAIARVALVFLFIARISSESF
jgi:hypothetical protein